MARLEKYLEIVAEDLSLKMREWFIRFLVIVVGSKGASKVMHLWSETKSIFFKELRDKSRVTNRLVHI